MQLGKHVYVQKPLTHDIYEAPALTEAAKRYKVVTQMGNQGASGDGVRQLQEWYDAHLIGEVHTVYCWTDRPPKALPGLSRGPACPKSWIGTCGWAPCPSGPTSISWWPSTGADGGSTAPARSATWAAT